MDPAQLLLVLILLADPAAKPAAEAAQARLQAAADEAKTPVRFVVGPDAVAALKTAGVTDSDLLSGPSVGEAFTRAQPRTALVRIERRLSGGNIVIEARVWLEGHAESHVAISDEKAGDPTDTTARGVGTVLSPWLALRARPDADGSDAALARLADGHQWHEVLAAKASGSARSGYYRIMALVNLGRRDEAEAAVAELRKAYPQHVLAGAAEGLVKGAVMPVDVAPTSPADDTGNTLR